MSVSKLALLASDSGRKGRVLQMRLPSYRKRSHRIALTPLLSGCIAGKPFKQAAGGPLATGAQSHTDLPRETGWSRSKCWILFLVMSGTAIQAIDRSSLSVANSVIARDLHFSLGAMGIVLSVSAGLIFSGTYLRGDCVTALERSESTGTGRRSGPLPRLSPDAPLVLYRCFLAGSLSDLASRSISPRRPRS